MAITKQTFKIPSIMKVAESTLINLPVPVSISYMWNLGSLLGVCLLMQIFSGVLLASAYSPSMDFSFSLVLKTMEFSDKGWLLRNAHANGASLFFICLYLHVGRGLYYGSYYFHPTWMSGTTMLILVMAAAFMGYVLPINQMSYWGASVITNLFTEVPYIGTSLVQLMWGGPSVGSPTMMRFFAFHFLIPFITLAMMMVHIAFLHETGSSPSIGVGSAQTKMKFSPFFVSKDLVGVTFMLLIFSFLLLYYPMIAGDDENFNEADPSVTPHHIQPEWYFLFAYAILRSIPNKLGGVIALALSVAVLYLLPSIHGSQKKSSSFYPINKIMFWSIISIVILLTWIGMSPVEPPFILTGQILTLLYFLYFILSPLMMNLWDSLSQC